MKRVAINYEFFASKMKMRVWEIRAELENIKKNMRLLNSEATKLDHLLTIVQSCHNRHGLGYTSVGNHVATSSKIVFVKIVPLV